MKIDKSSKIYRFNVLIYSQYRVRNLPDSCAYKWLTIKSLLKATTYFFIVLTLTFLTGAILNDEYNLVSSAWMFPVIGAVVCVSAIGILLGFMIGMSCLVDKCKSIKRKRVSSSEPSVISQWYDQAKNKYCTKLEFTD